MPSSNHNYDISTQEIRNNLSFGFIISFFGIELFPCDMIYSIYHKESNPSLKIYFETNSYYCFSAKRGGSIIDFYMQYKGVTFKEAISELKDLYAIQCIKTIKLNLKKDINHHQITKLRKGETKLFYNQYRKELYIKSRPPEIARSRAILKIKQNRKAALGNVFEFIYHHCNKLGYSDKGIAYLTGPDRKLTRRSIKKFKIIEIQDPQNLSYLCKKRFSEEELIQSGVFNEKLHFVFYYHHILIPHFKNGHIDFLRGRKIPISDDNRGKYTGLSGFTNKRIYNIDIMKSLIKGDKLILCEGELDTVIAIQAGYNAIGFPGVNGIPFDELSKLNLKQYELYAAFDNDSEGRAAVQEIANALGMNIKRIDLIAANDLTEVYHAQK